MAEIVIREDVDAWALEASARIATAIKEEGAASERTVSLILAGGTTPRPVYRRLAQSPEIPWGRVEVFFGDERCVPPGDAARNDRMAEASLLAWAPIEPSRVHRMHAERADRDAAARAYEELLPARPSVLLLGVGVDGHTASLFPRSSALAERQRRVVPVTVPAEPSERLTITPPLLEAAARLFVLVRGAAKARAVARAILGEPDADECPAQLARGGMWLLDREAAAELGARPPAR